MGRPLPFLAAAALLAACGSAPKAPPAERVLLQEKRAEEGKAPDRPPDWFDVAVRDALEQERRGHLPEALQLVEEALAHSPGPEHADSLREIRHRVYQAIQRAPVLAAEILPESERIVFGEAVRVIVRIRNVSAYPVSIPARPENASPSMFRIDVERRDIDTLAQVASTRRSILVPLARDIALKPGEITEQRVVLAEAGNDRPLDGFREFRVEGSLRPSVLLFGGIRRWDAYPAAPCRLRSYRPNYEHLMDDPVARIGQAIEKKAPVHLLTAAALTPPGRRRDAVDLLVAAIGRDPRLDGALFASLRVLTEVQFGRDADAWRKWWPRVRDRWEGPPPERPGPDEPAFPR